jgi:hypothetical protein
MPRRRLCGGEASLHQLGGIFSNVEDEVHGAVVGESGVGMQAAVVEVVTRFGAPIVAGTVRVKGADCGRSREAIPHFLAIGLAISRGSGSRGRAATVICELGDFRLSIRRIRG